MDYCTGLIHRKRLSDKQANQQIEMTENLIRKLGFKLSQINFMVTETPDYEEL
jgi:hypothetical protein